jgi:hypothetical protein
MFVLYLERQMPNNGENIVCYGYTKAIMLIYWLETKSLKHEKHVRNAMSNAFPSMELPLSHWATTEECFH